MSLLLLFSGAGDVEDDYGKKRDGYLYEDRKRLAMLHREDNEILEIIIAFVLRE
jgi:hypothetical protein